MQSLYSKVSEFCGSSSDDCHNAHLKWFLTHYGLLLSGIPQQSGDSVSESNARQAI